MTAVLATALALTAALLKLTTTRPGHLFPGPGEAAADDAEKIESTFETSVIPAAPAAVIFKKFLRLVDFLSPMSWSFFKIKRESTVNRLSNFYKILFTHVYVLPRFITCSPKFNPLIYGKNTFGAFFSVLTFFPLPEKHQFKRGCSTLMSGNTGGLINHGQSGYRLTIAFLIAIF